MALRGIHGLATCGDVVTANALEWGLHPFLSLIDGKTTRNTAVPSAAVEAHPWKRVERAENLAGTLSSELQAVVHELATGDGGLILVDGEEDLAVLPLLLELRAGSIVIYGQPGAGVCMVHVDDRIRILARELLGQMEVA